MKLRSTLFSFFMMAPALIVFILFNTSYFSHAVITMQQYAVPYACFLLIFSTIAVVYAPLNSGLMTLGSIPVLGWQLACSINIVGSLTGSVIAYVLAKRFGLQLIQKIFGVSIAEKIAKIKIKQSRSFEWVFVSRSLSSTFSDWICYAAGILKIPFLSFFLASLLSQLVIAIPLFYLYHLGLESGASKFLFLLILVGLVLLYTLRRRYFYKEDV